MVTSILAALLLGAACGEGNKGRGSDAGDPNGAVACQIPCLATIGKECVPMGSCNE